MLAVLGHKEEKDKLKDDRISLIEQSLSSLVKCRGILATTNHHEPSGATSSMGYKTSILDPRSTYQSHPRNIKMDFPRFDGL